MASKPSHHAGALALAGTPASAHGTDSVDEQALIARIRAGDTEAFEGIFHRHYAGLHALARRYLGSDDRAEDVVQEVFFTVWVHRAEWAPRTAIASYLYSAVRNRALNVIRSDVVVHRYAERLGQAADDRSLPLHVVGADEVHGARELDARIQRTIERLPERCREVFTMNREYGLSYTQIAEVLGVSVKTVEGHIVRALMALRKSLRDWLP
jgi:RNA polymerase sigma-70 factor (family 1)